MKYIIILLLFTSCITQKKVEHWLNDHQMQAAKYCSDRFPVVPEIDTVYKAPDTTKYAEAVNNLEQTLDSALAELKRKSAAATPEKPYRPNIDSIRSILVADIRRGVRPCKDSIQYIEITKVDKAREVYLQGLVDVKDDTITKLQNQNAKLQEKLSAARKWAWWFWILVTAIGLYIFARLKLKLPI